MKHMLVMLLGVTLCAAQNSSGQITAQPWAKFLGSWKDVPGPDDPSALRVEPESSSMKFSFNCKKDGSCLDVIIGRYDGKPNNGTGSLTWQAGFRKTGGRTLQEDGFSSGKPSTTVNWQLSEDGKTLTRTIHYIEPPSSKVPAEVYERDGGPVSKDDAFIGFWKRDWSKSDPYVLKYTSKGDLLTFTDPRGVVHDRNCDANDHPDTAFGSGASYSCRFPDDRTYELTSKRNGKVVSTTTRKISEDGKKMVGTSRNAEGKITAELTYEKID